MNQPQDKKEFANKTCEQTFKDNETRFHNLEVRVLSLENSRIDMGDTKTEAERRIYALEKVNADNEQTIITLREEVEITKGHNKNLRNSGFNKDRHIETVTASFLDKRQKEIAARFELSELKERLGCVGCEYSRCDG